MIVPIEVTFRGTERSPDIDNLVREQAGKLERFCDHVNSCRVAIEKPQQAQRSGRSYRVRIDVTVAPRHELVVRREPSRGQLHTPLTAEIRDAFKAMQRQIIELTQRQRGWVKKHGVGGEDQ